MANKVCNCVQAGTNYGKNVNGIFLKTIDFENTFQLEYLSVNFGRFSEMIFIRYKKESQ